jgi:hypothetical protein
MISSLERLGNRLLDLWIPHLTADAISAMPNGCSPSCACQWHASCPSGSGGYTGRCAWACVNLACHVTYACSLPPPPYQCTWGGGTTCYQT